MTITDRAYAATICGDCLYTSANSWDERETGRPLPEPAPLGRLHPQALVSWDDVEPHFSWHACHGCGCTLGGDRYDVRIVEPVGA
jgi:hypothetical protein